MGIDGGAGCRRRYQSLKAATLVRRHLDGDTHGRKNPCFCRVSPRPFGDTSAAQNGFSSLPMGSKWLPDLPLTVW